MEYMDSSSRNCTTFPERLAVEMNKSLQEEHVSENMTKGRTKLNQKAPRKGTSANNYKPITYLPMSWKILKVQIMEEIDLLLTNCRWSPEEQKGCCKGSSGTR